MTGPRFLQRCSPQRDELFLDTLRYGRSNARAAKVAGYALRTVYTWRDRDPQFAAAWNEAIQDGLDTRLAAPPGAPPWQPEPGPQQTAYDSAADIVLYGGAAGGGKTDLLLGLA